MPGKKKLAAPFLASSHQKWLKASTKKAMSVFCDHTQKTATIPSPLLLLRFLFLTPLSRKMADEELFKKIGLDDKKAAETAKNKDLSATLRSVIEEVSLLVYLGFSFRFLQIFLVSF